MRVRALEVEALAVVCIAVSLPVIMVGTYLWGGYIGHIVLQALVK